MKIKATLLSAVLCLTALGGLAHADLKDLKGKPLPAFSMKDGSGKVITSKSLKGKVLILDFWATWCGPCVAASPTMQSLHKKYASKGLVVLGCNTLNNSDLSAAKAYPKKHGYTYRFTYGNDDYGKKLGIKGIPVFIVVDRKGVVRLVINEFKKESTPAQIEKAVEAALKG